MWSSSITKTCLQWSFQASWNAAVPSNYFQDLFYQDDFLAATNKAAMSCCLQILTLTTGIKSPLLGSLPNRSEIRVGWVTVWAHTGKGESKEIAGQWRCSTRVTTQTFTQSQECSFPVGERVLHRPCAGSRPGAAGGPWPRWEAHPVWQPRHFCATGLFTPEHTGWHMCQGRGFEQVRTGKGPRAGMNKAAKLTCCITAGAWGVFHCACPKDKWKKHKCSATADMDCTHMPDWDWHWLSRVEVIWHQKRNEEPKAARPYEAYLLSYQWLKKSTQKWITIPSRHPSLCITCSGWQTTLLQLVIGSHRVSLCIFPAIY